MKKIIFLLLISIGISSCNQKELQKTEMAKINFTFSFKGEKNSFLLTYFSEFTPDNFFNQIVDETIRGYGYNLIDKDTMMELSEEDLFLLSSLSDGNDTIILIQWNKPLYKWKNKELTLPITRFIPETGEYFDSFITMGRANQLNGWWIMVK